MCNFCVNKTNSIDGMDKLDSLRLYSLIDEIIEENKDTIINNDNTIFACFFRKLTKQNIIRL